MELLFRKSRRKAVRVLISLAIVGIATGLQLLLGPIVGQVPFIFFFPAVVFASLLGSGLAAIALSVLAVQLLFLPEGRAGLFVWPADVIKQILFVSGASLIHWVTLRHSAALAASREAEARLAAVFQNALDAVVGMSDQGLVTHWNPRAEELFGFRREEALGRPMSATIIPHRMREAHEQGMRRYLATGSGPVLNKRIEVPALHKDGHELLVELTITPIRHAGGVSFAAFLRDISRRKADEAALREAVRARDEFISICSHELKTPVTAMKLQFQMAERQLRRGDPKVFREENTRKRVDTTLRQVDRMSRLIDDMLDVSRLNSGRLQIACTSFDLAELLRETCERFHEQFRAAGVSLDCTTRAAVPVHADRNRLDQVVSNLLSNALKYGAGKPVRVSLERRDGMARVLVRDEGPGITPGNLERIFRRFERGEPGDHVGGLGLGLYICQQIVQLMGGKIWAESEPGKGSSFLVELPVEGEGVLAG